MSEYSRSAFSSSKAQRKTIQSTLHLQTLQLTTTWNCAAVIIHGSRRYFKLCERDYGHYGVWSLVVLQTPWHDKEKKPENTFKIFAHKRSITTNFPYQITKPRFYRLIETTLTSGHLLSSISALPLIWYDFSGFLTIFCGNSSLPLKLLVDE